jgi:hypothetical protein
MKKQKDNSPRACMVILALLFFWEKEKGGDYCCTSMAISMLAVCPDGAVAFAFV